MKKTVIKPHKYSVFKDRYLLPYHLIATSSRNMDVFMLRDIYSSVHLDDSSMKDVNTANVFLRLQDCQSFQLFILVKNAYQKLK